MPTAEEHNIAQDVKDLHKIVATLAKTVGALAQRVDTIAAGPRDRSELPQGFDATNLRAFDLDPDAAIIPQLRDLLAEAGLRQVGTILVNAGPSMTLDELFKMIETPRPESFTEAAERILREFAKGCGNGKSGECDDCLIGAVSAIVAKHEEALKAATK